jgi:hypothetical protein
MTLEVTNEFSDRHELWGTGECNQEVLWFVKAYKMYIRIEFSAFIASCYAAKFILSIIALK